MLLRLLGNIAHNETDRFTNDATVAAAKMSKESVSLLASASK